MDLLVTLRGGLRDGRVEASIPEGATIADLAARFAGAPPPGAPDAPRLTLRILARSRGCDDGWETLDPDVDVRVSGLRSGDEVEPVPAPASHAEPAAAAVEVTGGPDRGRVHALRPGANLVGRDPSAAVPLGDPLVAARHASIHVGVSVEVRDLGSTGGIALAGTPVTRAPWRTGETLTLGGSRLRLIEAGSHHAPRTRGEGDRVTAAPRVLPPLPDAAIALPEPPQIPEPRTIPRAAMLAPALMGLAMFGVTGHTYSLVFVLMSPLVMLAGVLDSRWQRRRKLAELAEQFDGDLADAAARLADREPEERAALEARYPSTSQACLEVQIRGETLWSRRPEHPDFLAVRVGTGEVAAAAPPVAREGGTALPGARARVDALARRHATVPSAPVVASLASCGSAGFAGPHAARTARAAVLQVAALHAPTDCGVAVVGADVGHDRGWEWVGWLPHATTARAALGVHPCAAGDRRAELVSALEDLVASRAGTEIAEALPAPRTDPGDGARAVPGRLTLVVLVDGACTTERERLIRLAERGPDHGVHLLWVADEPRDVPGACRSVVVTTDDGALSGDTILGGPATAIAPEAVSAAQAERVARMLAPLTDAAAIAAAAAALPRSVPLVELHGHDVLDPQVHAARWSAMPRPDRSGSLRALVGSSAEGPEYLDLAHQGPHALVGGTTGSGKSELLQSWILGMACAHGPEIVTFLLVDYKGGAAFADCVRLPHSVGLVTDLDPRLADRVLTSLRAEVTHRETLLADAGAKDIDALMASGSKAPPRLVVVIDEFATLVAEVPAFIDGVLDIAQRGRSLGLHLIMATQRPAGVIRDSLRANTNLRLALRMADEADSRDVVGETSAAALDPGAPGRVLVRTGPGRLRMLQSAYGGACTSAESSSAPRIAVRDVHQHGAGQWPELARPAATAPTDSDAARVVSALRAAHRLTGGGIVRRPWLDELPDCLALDGLPSSPGRLALGLVDDPARQSQTTLTLDLEADGALLVVSGPGAGASTLLRTIAAASAPADGRPPVHVYGIDGGGGGLLPAQHLSHVGDIVEHDDDERVARLLDSLASLVRTRRVELGDVAGAPGSRARVLLLVDDAAQLQAGCLHVPGREKVWEDLRTIVADGAAAGVHVAMTVARSGALHTSLRALMTRLLLLRTADDAEYALAGLRSARVAVDARPGRGLDAATGLEFQIAVPGGSPRIDLQVRALAELGRAPIADPPARVPHMPRTVSATRMPSHVGGLPVLGVDEQSLMPVGCEVERGFVIAGPAGSGRTSTLAWLASAVRAAEPDATVVHLCLRRSRLGMLTAWTDSVTGVAAGREFMDRWAQPLEDPRDDGAGIVVMVEHLEDLGPGSPDAAVAQVLRQAMRRGHAVVAEADIQGWVGPLAADIRAARRGIVLAAQPSDVQVLLGVRGPRLPEDAPPGRGVLVEPGSRRVVQVPWMQELFSTDRSSTRRPDVARS